MDLGGHKMALSASRWFQKLTLKPNSVLLRITYNISPLTCVLIIIIILLGNEINTVQFYSSTLAEQLIVLN